MAYLKTSAITIAKPIIFWSRTFQRKISNYVKRKSSALLHIRCTALAPVLTWKPFYKSDNREILMAPHIVAGSKQLARQQIWLSRFLFELVYRTCTRLQVALAFFILSTTNAANSTRVDEVLACDWLKALVQAWEVPGTKARQITKRAHKSSQHHILFTKLHLWADQRPEKEPEMMGSSKSVHSRTLIFEYLQAAELVYKPSLNYDDIADYVNVESYQSAMTRIHISQSFRDKECYAYISFLLLARHDKEQCI